MSTRSCKVLTKEDVPEVAAVVTKAFCRHGLASYMKYDEKAYEEWITQLAYGYVDDGYSSVVRDTATNKVIGGSVARLGSNNAFPEEFVEKFSPIAYAHLELPQYIKDEDPSKVLYGEKVGTLPVEEGGQRGIAEELFILSANMAKSNGVRYIVCSLTNPRMITVTSKFGLKQEAEIVFAESGISQYKGVPGKGVLGVLDLDNWIDPLAK